VLQRLLDLSNLAAQFGDPVVIRSGEKSCIQATDGSGAIMNLMPCKNDLLRGKPGAAPADGGGPAALRDGPQDAEAVNGLFRAAHTIKGSAGLFGFDEVVRFTHVVESVLDRCAAARSKSAAN
jgi:hypothetical protein